MAAVIGTLRAELTATIAQFQRDLGKAADSVKAMSKEFTKVSRDFQQTGRQMQTVGTALTKTITLPILGFGLAAAKASIQFESAFSNVAKTVDGVSDKSGKLTEAGKALAQTFRDMAKTIPATTDELTAIAALGGQMGVPIGQLEKFTENVAALGVAVDGLSTEEAAAGLASIGNATGTGTTKIAEMSSALVHLGNNSNATEAQILEFTKRLVGAGHAVGMTVPEVMALGTAMANVGINAEAGGTAMSTVISKMSNAVSQGGDALTEFARVANMSGDAFAAKWKSKPIEAVDAFVKGLSSMRERGVDLNLTMGELGTEGIRTADTLKRLSGAGDGVGKALVFANEGFDTANKHLEEAEKKYANTANQIKILWNRITDIGITLGDALNPAIKASIEWLEKLLPYVDKLAKAFADLPGNVQLAVLAIGGIGAAAGPAIWGIGQLISSMGQIAGAFGKGGVASRGMLTAVNGLRRGLETLKNVQIGTGALGMLASGGGIGLGIAAMYLAAGELADEYKAKLEAQTDAMRKAGTPIAGLRTDLKTLADAEAAAAQHGQDLTDGLEITVPSLKGLAVASGTGAEAVKNFGEKLAAAQAELDTFAKEQPRAFADFVAAVQSGHFEMEELEKQTGLSKLAIDVFTTSLERNKTAQHDAAEAAKEHKEGLDFLRDEFFKVAQAIEALNAAAENEDLAEQYRQAASQIEFINTQVGEWTDRNEELEAALSDIYGVAGRINGVFEEAIPITKQIGETLEKTFKGLPKLISDALIGGGGFLGAAKAFGVQLADAILQPLMAELTSTFAAFFRSLGAKIAGQVTGAAVASSATAAIAGTAAASTAAATGGAAAAGGGAVAAGAGGAGVIGGLSLAQAVPIAGGIALAAYGLYKGFKALKEQAAHKEVNRLREAFFTLEGGLDSLNPRVQFLTGNVKAVQAVFDARNPEQYNKALANLNVILEKGKRDFEDLRAAAGTVSDRLVHLTTVTPDVQKALDAVFDAKTTEDYLKAIKTLNGELDKQEATYNGIRDAMAKYGIAFKDAGKDFQQATLNERAQELTKDFILLRDSGMDINAQMRGMGKSINDFVHDAKKAGLEVPESMRSIIQTAIDAGEIFDDNGDKITDMSQLGLTFGTTMQTSMEHVGSAIDRLTLVLEALAKFLKIDLPDAAKEGADKTNAALDTIDDKEVTITVKHQEIPADMPPPDLPGPETPGAPEGAATGAWVRPWGLQHLAGGGFAARGTDTIPAMLTPGELVLNANQQRALFGAQAAIVVNLSIAIDGVFSEGDLVQTVQRRVAPILAQTIEDNVAGSRTRFQDVLGVP